MIKSWEKVDGCDGSKPEEDPLSKAGPREEHDTRAEGTETSKLDDLQEDDDDTEAFSDEDSEEDAEEWMGRNVRVRFMFICTLHPGSALAAKDSPSYE